MGEGGVVTNIVTNGLGLGVFCEHGLCTVLGASDDLYRLRCCTAEELHLPGCCTADELDRPGSCTVLEAAPPTSCTDLGAAPSCAAPSWELHPLKGHPPSSHVTRTANPRTEGWPRFGTGDPALGRVTPLWNGHARYVGTPQVGTGPWLLKNPSTTLSKSVLKYEKIPRVWNELPTSYWPLFWLNTATF